MNCAGLSPSCACRDSMRATVVLRMVPQQVYIGGQLTVLPTWGLYDIHLVWLAHGGVPIPRASARQNQQQSDTLSCSGFKCRLDVRE